MATVSSFEGLRQPRSADLRQFCELFEPLFAASSDEARRQAAAALARSPHVPSSVALQIGSAPIAIAALFLTRAMSIDERVLLDIIRNQSAAHASAIARRDNLSVRVVDALVEKRDSAPGREFPTRGENPASEMPALENSPLETTAAETAAIAARAREERRRAELKALARSVGQPSQAPAAPARRPLLALDATHEALLVRFSRSGEVNLFAATLSHALDCSAVFGERLVLDVSGWQLAVTLSALGTDRAEMVRMLTTLYPYLAERSGAGTRCDALLDGIDSLEARARVEGWIAADDARRDGSHRHSPVLGPERATDPRQPSSYPASANQTPANQTQEVVSTFYRRSLGRGAR
ncbi:MULTISPECIES: DUF2336 domain-containing protein [unclassified Rhizobium]|uniref:DUF2336 domain-containing protein n=1 Tax=unclassified Rhizobium TaxID=2613769 RepID=UPI0012E3C92A|nr:MULTISPECIES: DUF2336 domain-containing protein [unclassified Rhizobium]